MLLEFPKSRHGRASRGSASIFGRAASDVSLSDERPTAAATAVARMADHHSTGIESRFHHLLTCVVVAPMSDAIATLEPQRSMIERNDVGADMESSIGHNGLIGKAILADDCGEPFQHYCGMPKRPARTTFKKGFIGRVRAARRAKGLTQDQVAIALGLGTQNDYKHYEKRSYLPHDLIEPFCLLCGVEIGYLYTGKKAYPVSRLVKSRAA